MTVYVNNITINTGEYFSRDFYLDNIDGTPLNLVGYAASSYIRKHPESLNPTAKFNVGFIDRNNGRIRVSLASTVTASIKPGRYVYDVLFTDNTTKKSIVIEGNILATEDVSTDCLFLKTDYANKFGFIPFDNQTVTANGNYPSNTIDEITINDINDYGVIIFGYADKCGTLPNLVSFLQNPTNIDIINQYLYRGGVVWFRGEWRGSFGICAPAADQNLALAALGTNIRVKGVGHVPSTTTNISGSTVLPATLNHDATNGLDGGIALYESSSNGFITVAYEKVNNGVIFVNADVNGSFTSPSDELYDGIRDLVTANEYTPTVTTPNYNPNP